MASAAGDTKNQFCSLCEEEYINNPAATWCTDCETFLCSDCERHHGRSKASKEHNTIPAENYNELSDFITSTAIKCKEHWKRFEFYCSFHQVACCLECVTKNHNNCNELRDLADVLKGYKASSSVAHIEGDLRDIQTNFEKTTKHLKSRLGDIDAQKRKGLKQIKDMRRKINDHLDKLEQKLLDDFDDKYIKIKSDIENLLKEMENKTTQADQLETDFNKMKKFATELQTFVGIKEMEKMTNEMANYLIGTKTKSLADKNNVDIEMFSEILKVESLGNVNVSLVPANLQLVIHKEQQACMLVQKTVKIQQIKPKLLKKIDIGINMSVTGCLILPSGQMLVVEQNSKRLMLFSVDGSFVRVVVAFSGIPYDVTYIKDNTVAVTTFSDRKVHFVDFEKNIILKSKNISQNCFGIDSDGEVFRTNCGGNKCIISLNVNGSSELSSQMIPSNSSDIATFCENIYITEYNENRVKCLSKKGDVLWTYQLTEGRYPRGLSVDKHGFVYVACYSSNNVFVISPEGNESCVILTKDDGMLKPFALNITKNMSKLLVANGNNSEAFLYQI